jgi:hypothetical protein
MQPCICMTTAEELHVTGVGPSNPSSANRQHDPFTSKVIKVPQIAQSRGAQHVLLMLLSCSDDLFTA